MSMNKPRQKFYFRWPWRLHCTLIVLSSSSALSTCHNILPLWQHQWGPSVLVRSTDSVDQKGRRRRLQTKSFVFTKLTEWKVCILFPGRWYLSLGRLLCFVSSSRCEAWLLPLHVWWMPIACPLFWSRTLIARLSFPATHRHVRFRWLIVPKEICDRSVHVWARSVFGTNTYSNFIELVFLQRKS